VVAAVLAGLVVVLVCFWLWLRDSSLVGVRRVTVTGLSGPHVAAIRGALREAALTMTTLDVDTGRLERAVQRFPDVRSLSVTTSFPHGIAIHVDETVPVATVTVGGRTLAVSSRGVLMRGVLGSDGALPALAAAPPPGAERVIGSGARAALRVLAAAPYAILAHVASAAWTASHGVTLRLRRGPELYFGPADDLAAKWRAVIGVLGSQGVAGASYIDVVDPDRPAAGTTASASRLQAAQPAGTGTSGATAGIDTTGASPTDVTATGTAGATATGTAGATATGTAGATATGTAGPTATGGTYGTPATGGAGAAPTGGTGTG
jgi:cell division protein FtsQ